MSRLHQKLTKHIPEQDRDAYERQLEKLLDFIEPVLLTLDYEENKIIKEKTSSNSFDNANWAYQQAFYNGQIQTIELVKKILTLRKKLEETDQSDI